MSSLKLYIFYAFFGIRIQPEQIKICINSLRKISPNLVLQLLLLLLRPPASDPAEDSLPFPEELSL